MTDDIGRIPSKAEFASVLDSSFLAYSSGGSEFSVRLMELNDSSSTVQETYSLEFVAPVKTAPLQGIYRLVHEKLGEIEMFLVPIKKDETGLYFEAVFNRFLEPAN